MFFLPHNGGGFSQYNQSDAINICSNRMYNIKEIAEIILKACNYNVEIQFNTAKLDCVPFRMLSNWKFTSLFGNREYIKFEDGVQDVINWVKK